MRQIWCFGTILLLVAVSVPAAAGRHGRGGGGVESGDAVPTRARVRDGSCAQERNAVRERVRAGDAEMQRTRLRDRSGQESPVSPAPTAPTE